MNALLAIDIFLAGGFVGLIFGCAHNLSARFNLLDELDDAQAELERLRGRE
ncbi:hypothetical protein [Sphingopyxis sp. 113P3]|uniref:hypothetical protein n=1 Tax=Sphingopyxis sp. (strain 113P3) TaxID=292913 RepID=UPI0006BC4D35|nr:hypothetical protein [Sphingopyxis sp. 113P3]ALC12505.1 hypothetical protein LH20_11135 [Sphingopyxis sp. 113P3]